MTKPTIYKYSETTKTEFTGQMQSELDELHKYAEALGLLQTETKAAFPKVRGGTSNIDLEIERVVEKIVDLEITRLKAGFKIPDK